MFFSHFVITSFRVPQPPELAASQLISAGGVIPVPFFNKVVWGFVSGGALLSFFIMFDLLQSRVLRTLIN